MKKLTLVLCAVLMMACTSKKSIVADDISCNGIPHSVGVPIEEVSFSWIIASDVRSTEQSAYRIVVSSSPEKLKSGEYDIWDSGKVESNRAQLVPLGASKVKSAHRYWWKVLLWNQDGQEGNWSDTDSFVTSLEKNPKFYDAKWIALEEMPKEDYYVPGVHRLEEAQIAGVLGKSSKIPALRRSFSVEKKPTEALLFISGLGHYEASLNGEKISSAVLTPGWSDYRKTVLYNSYDVTDMIEKGENVLSALVGNGFYYVNIERYVKLGVAYGYPKMISSLVLRFDDGSEKVITSDESWKVCQSPITFSSIYGGEDYDATLEQEGWDKKGFDDSKWQSAMVVAAPQGELKPETGYPVKYMERIVTNNFKKLDDGRYTYDFGQNAAGNVEIKVKGKKGAKVKIYPGELVYPNGVVNQEATGGPCYYTYTKKSDVEESWRPRFTYYGLKYATVEGAVPASEAKDGQASIEEIALIHNRNSTPTVGRFECSSDLMNRIFVLIDWAIKSNTQSVTTDCPHREKLGWLEQTYLMGRSIHYNYDLLHVYRKQIRDMIDSQLPSGLVPDIAPEYVVFDGGFRDTPEWGSASVFLPWMVYQWYGDDQILPEAYDMICRYIAYLGSKATDNILNHGLGDWFDYGPGAPGDAQLTPNSLSGTATYYLDVIYASRIAAKLGKDDDARRFAALAADIKEAFNKKFYNSETGGYSTESQTAISMPLVVGMVDPENRDKVYKALQRTIERDGYGLTAGDVGFHYLVDAMTTAGHHDMLYKMVNRSDVAGYGYQLAKGATALTESWAALENVSNNHLMLGHIMEWFYTSLLGIKECENSVAGSLIEISPSIVGDITSAKGWYRSPKGVIGSDWKMVGNTITMKVDVPYGCVARVAAPKGFKMTKESGSDIAKLSSSVEENGMSYYVVKGGNYIFEAVKE